MIRNITIPVDKTQTVVSTNFDDTPQRAIMAGNASTKIFKTGSNVKYCFLLFMNRLRFYYRRLGGGMTGGGGIVKGGTVQLGDIPPGTPSSGRAIPQPIRHPRSTPVMQVKNSTAQVA